MRERWKHALSAIKSSPQKDPSLSLPLSFSFIHSLLPPPLTLDIHFSDSLNSWVFLLDVYYHLDKGVWILLKNLAFFCFRSKIPTFHVKRWGGYILFLALSSIIPIHGSSQFSLTTRNYYWSQLVELLLLFLSPFWRVMVGFERYAMLCFYFIIYFYSHEFLCNIFFG